jgi:hypothetical protein
MLKNIVLFVSLGLNALVAYVVFNPSTISGPKMSCEEARSEVLNKKAAYAFAQESDGSFFKVHWFLRASDYSLRNIAMADGSTVFVYTAHTYPSTCGSLLSGGIDGSIVRVTTDLAVEPKIIDVH